MEEFSALSIDGQYDNVILEDVPKVSDNNILDTNFNENDAFDDDSDFDYDNEDNYVKYETDKSQLRAENVQNYYSWADKMDLLKVKSNSKATDKSDNSTYDRVLDGRSLTIMYKMMRQKIFSKVNGNISAGKEANVYHAPTEDGQDLVVKVYMTSIMPFKSRDKYMSGDFRFKNSNTSSSAKLVKTWAEKEYRNLLRIYETNGAIPCPKPIKQTGMVLVMSMIGKMGEAAPKLKDLQFENEEEWSRLYEQVLTYVRILFQECRLIHADLSEYNLLYHEDKIWMIDVSQSVEHFHPEALTFLRNDCHTINTFFRNKGIKTLSLREFFDYVVDPNITKDVHEIVENSNYFLNGEQDQFFLKCHIPRTLMDVPEFMKEFLKLRKDENYIDNIPYASVTGMTSELKNIRNNAKQSIKTHKNTLKSLKKQLADDNINQSNADDNQSNAVDNQSDSVDNQSDDVKEIDAATLKNIEKQNLATEEQKKFLRPAFEDKESKKLRKKLVKEVQRENRIENKQKEVAEKIRTMKGYKRRNLNC